MDVRKRLLELSIPERIQGEPFVIYPYGAVGKKVKEILNKEFSLSELAVIDENVSKETDKIQGVDFLDSPECQRAYIIIASDNVEIYDEIRNNVRNRFDFTKVIDMSGAVNTSIDRRIESLRLCADVINQIVIKGAVAEAGVFEGEFARYMNLFFKDRTLYLFDTFEGFEGEKLKNNVDECWDNWMKKMIISL